MKDSKDCISKCRNRNYRERKGNKKKNEIHERKLLLEIFKKKKNSRKTSNIKRIKKEMKAESKL